MSVRDLFKARGCNCDALAGLANALRGQTTSAPCPVHNPQAVASQQAVETERREALELAAFVREREAFIERATAGAVERQAQEREQALQAALDQIPDPLTRALVIVSNPELRAGRQREANRFSNYLNGAENGTANPDNPDGPTAA